MHRSARDIDSGKATNVMVGKWKVVWVMLICLTAGISIGRAYCDFMYELVQKWRAEDLKFSKEQEDHIDYLERQMKHWGIRHQARPTRWKIEAKNDGC